MCHISKIHYYTGYLESIVGYFKYRQDFNLYVGILCVLFSVIYEKFIYKSYKQESRFFNENYVKIGM